MERLREERIMSALYLQCLQAMQADKAGWGFRV